MAKGLSDKMKDAAMAVPEARCSGVWSVEATHL